MPVKKTTKQAKDEVCIPEAIIDAVQEVVEVPQTVNESFAKLLEIYKVQSPVKYELKKKELEAKLLNK
jgi:hypothetical protein